MELLGFLTVTHTSKKLVKMFGVVVVVVAGRHHEHRVGGGDRSEWMRGTGSKGLSGQQRGPNRNDNLLGRFGVQKECRF